MARIEDKILIFLICKKEKKTKKVEIKKGKKHKVVAYGIKER